jgi:hypothetical protein
LSANITYRQVVREFGGVFSPVEEEECVDERDMSLTATGLETGDLLVIGAYFLIVLAVGIWVRPLYFIIASLNIN